MLFAEISWKIGSVTLGTAQSIILGLIVVAVLYMIIFGDPITKTGLEIRRERRNKQIEKRLKKMDADR